MVNPIPYHSLLYQMIQIRHTQEKIATLYAEQEMRCPVHLCIGQEAVPVGICGALNSSDYAFSCHRSHGHYLAKGGSLQQLLAELYGKRTGCCHGRGGSMHLVDIEAGFMGSTSIIAGTIPVAVGSALSAKIQNQHKVAVAFFGDAAVEEGLFHESVNFATVHKLPVIFVCENNLYSVYAHIRRRQPNREIFSMVAGHGIRSVHCDGNDVLAVLNEALTAVERARSGEGPTFIECGTYRWLEHCGPGNDNALGYRDLNEYESWIAHCPIQKLQKNLIDNNLVTSAELDTMIQAIDNEINQAVKFAKESPFPEPGELMQHLYFEKESNR